MTTTTDRPPQERGVDKVLEQRGGMEMTWQGPGRVGGTQTRAFPASTRETERYGRTFLEGDKSLLRSDAPLIRHLAEGYGSVMARAWQALPLIQSPDPATLPTGVDTRGLWTLPFDDFVLDFGRFVVKAEEVRGVYRDQKPGRQWTRVVDAQRYLRTLGRLAPWWALEPPQVMPNGKPLPKGIRWPLIPEQLTLARRGVPDAGVVLETWLQVGTDLLPSPEIVVVNRETGTTKPLLTAVDWLVYQRSSEHEWDEIMREERQHATWAIWLASYLGGCPEYLVEQRPARAPGPRPVPQKDKKPWTAQGLPRIILWHPDQAPPAKPLPAGVDKGHHASPRPHRRRGHWRTLRAARYKQPGLHLFIKPTFVGPQEWERDGTVYRVLPGQQGQRGERA